MKIYFFDTETTGNTTEDVLCQLAVKERFVDTPLLNSLYNPKRNIPFEASAIHHITNKMVNDKPVFRESDEYQIIKNIFESENTYVVAHNSAFDDQMLKNEDINSKNIICTFKVIRALDTENKFKMHKLQYLRYALDIEIEASAHDAFGDVLVLEKVFEYELQQLKEKFGLDEESALNRMVEISKNPLEIRLIDFGKYRGCTIEEVAKKDPGYISWLLDQKRNSDKDENDWIYTLEKALELK